MSYEQKPTQMVSPRGIAAAAQGAYNQMGRPPRPEMCMQTPQSHYQNNYQQNYGTGAAAQYGHGRSPNRY